MKPDFYTVTNDPDFYKLPFEEQKKVLRKVDPDFMKLPDLEQDRAMTMIGERWKTKSGAPQEPTSQQEISNETQPSHPSNWPMAQAHQRPQPEPTWTDRLAGAREALLGPNSNVTIKDIAPYYRMLLEGGGAAAGTTAGLLTGGPPASAALGGVGYAGGKNVSDILDQFGGVEHATTSLDRYFDPAGQLMQRDSAAERITRPIRDTAAGIGMGAAGELAARGVMAIPNAAKGVIQWMKKPIVSREAAEKAAGEFLMANTSDGPIFARNIQEAKEIEDLINKGAKEGEPLFRFSVAQRSFDPNLVKAERSAVLPQGTAATSKVQQDAANSEAIRNYYQRNFGGKEGAEDVLASLTRTKELGQAAQNAAQEAADLAAGRVISRSESPQTTGARIIKDLQEAKRPVKATLTELEQQIPDYPLELKNLNSKIDEFLKDPKLSLNQRRAVEEFKGQLAELTEGGTTTHKAIGINRTLNQNAKEAYHAGKDDIGRIMTMLKQDGLQADIDAISSLARTGKLVQHKGQLIDADKIASELEKSLETLAKQKQATSVDIDAMVDAIDKKTGFRPMRVTREPETQYAERISQQYKNVVGGELPTKSSMTGAANQALEKKIAELRQTLSEVSPGQDVGAAMSAYNRFAKTEYAEKFKTGAVEQALRKGQQATGTRLRIEQIPEQFKTPSGADDLIRAVGPDKARESMTGSFAYDLFKSSTDGRITTRQLENFLAKNKAVIEKYGLQGEFASLQKAQRLVDRAGEALGTFEKSVAGRLLGSDPDSLVKQLISGGKTAERMKEMVETVQNDPAALAGLKNAFAKNIVDESRLTWKNIVNDPTTSTDKFVKQMKKAAEAAKILYAGEPEKIEALQTMQRSYEIAARTSRSPVGTGSDTAEKSTNLASQVVTIAGGLSAKMRLGKAFSDYFNRLGQKKVDEIVGRALFDPDYADMLIRGVKGKFDPNKLDVQVGNKIIRLDDYRQSKFRQAVMAGGSSAASGDGD